MLSYCYFDKMVLRFAPLFLITVTESDLIVMVVVFVGGNVVVAGDLLLDDGTLMEMSSSMTMTKSSSM